MAQRDARPGRPPAAPARGAAVGNELARGLDEDGIVLRLGAAEKRVEEASGRVKLFLGDGRCVESERLVAAVGRRPCMDEIGLEATASNPAKLAASM